MVGVPGQVRWADFRADDLAWLRLKTCVDEDHQGGKAGWFRQFGRELMSRDNLDFRRGKSVCQLLSDVPSQPIIGPQGIAVADDEDAGHLLR